MEPRFFSTPSAFRTWLEKHHATSKELWVGFYRKGTGKPSITWPEAVDQALCFGWIDSVRKRLDDVSYANRFTPRTPTSTWSAVNTKRVKELTRLGLMRPAGLKAFRERAAERSGIYSYEQRNAASLSKDQEKQFRSNKRAWDFFQAQPPSYRQGAIWWVVSAKRESTRAGRLATLIGDSESGRTVRPLTRPSGGS
jgi:uncharacterized protein YdeI (YjbR/CyaY-like superfamily)